MAPTFLIVGATGNTGKSVVETLSKILENQPAFSGYRILAQTRSANATTAQQFSQLPHVEVVEKAWVGINHAWLREYNVVRAFIASHNQPNQFAEDSAFHVAALNAGVEYVTSLQPNGFSHFCLAPAAELIKTYRKTGKQDTLRLLLAEDAPMGIIDLNDVGIFAAHLLATDDITPHNKAKYVLNGPEDITGPQIVDLVEERICTKVEDVKFKDMTFVEVIASDHCQPYVIMSIKHALEPAWEGKCTASTTSKEVLQIAAPKSTPIEVLTALLEV